MLLKIITINTYIDLSLAVIRDAANVSSDRRRAVSGKRPNITLFLHL